MPTRGEGSPRASTALAVAFALGAVLTCPATGEAATATAAAPDADAATPEASAPTASLLDPSKQWRALDDPTTDGWASEAAYAAVSQQLRAVFDALAQAAAGSTGDASAALAGESFTSAALLPRDLTVVFDNAVVTVERALAAKTAETETADEAGQEHAPEFLGAEGFAAGLSELGHAFDEIDRARCHASVVGIRVGDDGIETRQRITIAGLSHGMPTELHSVWDAVWTQPASSAPLLTSIEVLDFERTRSKRPATAFTDATEKALGADPAFSRQLAQGFGYWAERISDWPSYENLATPGLAVADVNGDGRDDLYLGQQAGLPNLLLLQGPDGTFADESTEGGVDWLDDTRGVLLVDLDNDGDADIAAATVGHVIVAANDGHGRFRTTGVFATADDTMSLTAADYDLDGDLDLYVTAYYPTMDGGHGAVLQAGGATGAANKASRDGAAAEPRSGAAAGYLYHDANDGGRNTLLRNEGRWRFEDVTAAVGLDANNRRWSFAASWQDFDDDGDDDLYVANDYGRNNLYRNEGGHFADVARPTGTEDMASGMSATWGDYDRDGDMDLYVSNMFSSAGNRVVTQDRFASGKTDEFRATLERFARGNSLLTNDGDGGFSDDGMAAGVAPAGWAWAAKFADWDNDGREDLVVANGYITTDDTGDL